MNVKILIMVLSVFLSINVYAKDDSFGDYSKQSDSDMKAFSGEYNTYKNNIDRDFDEYKKITDDEIAKFSIKAKKIWGDATLSTNKMWVEYSKDMKTRGLVDYETGLIKVESIANDRKSAEKIIESELIKMIKSNSSDAYKSDEVNMNVEKRLKGGKIAAEYSNVAAKPMLADILSDKQSISDTEAKTLAQKLIKEGKFEETQTPAGELVTFSVKVDTSEKPNTKGIETLSANKEIGAIHKKASTYKNTVVKNAKERRVPEALVYSVIHNESSFNPMATSGAPAYGMMQLVPSSGGREAASILFGKPMVLAPSYLYNAENNIQLGSIYLSQLYHYYFKDVTNSESRLYCAISAYNTGPGNVSRTFTGATKIPEAIKKINTMTPSEVYSTLRSNLPYAETRSYLQKVTTSYNAYKSF